MNSLKCPSAIRRWGNNSRRADGNTAAINAVRGLGTTVPRPPVAVQPAASLASKLKSLNFSFANTPIRQRTNGSRRACPVVAAAAAASSPVSQILRFIENNFIPVGLLTATTIGWLFPAMGAQAAANGLQKFSTIGIFIVSGILLQRGETMVALKSPVALLYGIAATLFLTPLAAFPVLHLPLHPPEMRLGLAVFCCVPTTLSTCVTLTNACRGNSAVALLLVVATSVLGVFTIPAVLGFVLGAAANGAMFDQTALFRNLVMTVLAPLLVGVGLQATVPGLPEWRNHNRKLLSYVSTFFLCMVPWMQLSVASSSKLPLGAVSVAAAAAASAALHVVFLAFNSVVAAVLRFSRNAAQDVAIRKAVVLCTSEKTLPVAVAVLNQLSTVGGAAVGLAVVPCVMAHIIQIAIDSVVVSWWNRKEEEEAALATTVTA